jgi:hypothetical protein
LLAFGAVVARPCGVVRLDAVLLHHFLELTVADRVRHIPAPPPLAFHLLRRRNLGQPRPKNDVPLKMTALELDHHLLAAETVAGKRTPGGLVGQICDRTTESSATVSSLWQVSARRAARPYRRAVQRSGTLGVRQRSVSIGNAGIARVRRWRATCQIFLLQFSIYHRIAMDTSHPVTQACRSDVSSPWTASNQTGV